MALERKVIAMWIQQSYRDKHRQGALYLVPTPIGNLEDMTFRAVSVLREADLIAAEDTRNTKKLCSHFNIDTPLASYHEHNKEQSGAHLLKKIEEGKKVALVSDAGMPGISDPGYELVKACNDRELFIIPLPGANAALPALVGSSFEAHHFYFYGFLPRDKKERKQELTRLQAHEDPSIFYEAPHRLKETLADMCEQFGERRVCVAREVTKIYEEWLRGELRQVRERLDTQKLKGEFAIVVEGSRDEETKEPPWWTGLSVCEHVDHYVLIRKWSKKEAVKQTAQDRGLPKREVYNAYHRDREQ